MNQAVSRQQGQPEARGFDIIVVASSAGGLEALSIVLGGLPSGFPVPVVIVQHLDPRHRSLMAEILRRRTSLHVEQAVEGSRLTPSSVIVAPPDEHLLVTADGTVNLSHSELVHFVRPSADLLFESAAGAFPGRVIGVVLTGTGADASMGVRAIGQTGGTVIVENPKTAAFAGMPQAAIDSGHVDFVLELTEIAPALLALLAREATP